MIQGAPAAALVSKQSAGSLEVAPWDQIAPIRAADLDRGGDPSYQFVIRPTIAKLVGKSNRQRTLLDIGCGVGRLTRVLAAANMDVTGIDPSSVSAHFAAEHNARKARILNHSIASFAETEPPQFDVCVASMVLQDVVELRDFVDQARRLTVHDGRFIASIAHPFFWPQYWGYDTAKWFSYTDELFIRSQFRTSRSSYAIETLHVHRPLQQYVETLSAASFRLVRVVEPLMPERRQRQAGVTWSHPHFMFLEARAT